MGIHGHLIELYQLLAALVGAIAAAVLLYFADKVRREYRSTGENDPEILAAAAANIRDEGFRLTKHLLIVVIGIVTIIMEPAVGDVEERAQIVRWILILISTLMVVQSVMVWRDRIDAGRRAQLRNRRSTDTPPYRRRGTDNEAS